MAKEKKKEEEEEEEETTKPPPSSSDDDSKTKEDDDRGANANANANATDVDDPKKEEEDEQPPAAAAHRSEEEEGGEEDALMTATTFRELGVVAALAEACDRLEWKTATQIQKQVLPDALAGRDVIGLAETGSGKTAAFAIPVLQGLLEKPVRATAAVVLTPTRELAVQIHAVVQALGSGLGATSCCVVGGVDRTAQSIALARLPHVLVATPGRLLDHLRDTKGFHLRRVRFLVLDEADRMLSLDFEQELHAILDELPSEQRQTLLFSATMTSQVQKLERASLKRDAVRVRVGGGGGGHNTKFQTPKQLHQTYLFVPAKYKDCYLTYIINEHAGQSVLVFAATCWNVQRLALALRNLGFPAVALHGRMRQSARLGALRKFSSGDRTVLVCTDVAARGLDLPAVDLVVNFDLPGHGKEYVHRVGRTARAGKSGKAVAMVTQYDVEVYQRLEQLLGRRLPAYPVPDEATVLVLLERVSDAQRRATRELKEQLAAAKGHGLRRKRRGGGGGDGDNDWDGSGNDGDDPQERLQREVVQGYLGGSGGRGGALPNQRGGRSSSNGHHNKKKQNKRRR